MCLLKIHHRLLLETLCTIFHHTCIPFWYLMVPLHGNLSYSVAPLIISVHLFWQRMFNWWLMHILHVADWIAFSVTQPPVLKHWRESIALTPSRENHLVMASFPNCVLWKWHFTPFMPDLLPFVHSAGLASFCQSFCKNMLSTAVTVDVLTRFLTKYSENLHQLLSTHYSARIYRHMFSSQSELTFVFFCYVQLSVCQLCSLV